jgi:hypothetical protein
MWQLAGGRGVIVCVPYLPPYLISSACGLIVPAPAALFPCPPAPCSNLKRYLHYLTRYEANLQSKKMEEKLREVGGCCRCW